MGGDWRKRIQITLIIFLVIALVRVGFIFYGRTHEPEVRKPQPSSSSSYRITLDDYVAQHKLYLYDLQSAREVVGKTVWVRAGNQFAYYPYTKAARRADTGHAAGLLAPLEKLQVKGVITESVREQKQVMAVFAREGSAAEYAVSVGKVSGGSYDFFINDVFLIDDPHLLYSHWPAEVWSAIDHHEVKPGMNELQVGFALGTNIRVGGGDYGNRSVQYINGDKSIMVSFSDNKVVSVDPGPHP